MGVLYAVHFRVIGTNKLEFGSLFPLFYHVSCQLLAVSFWGAGQLAEPHYSQHLDYCRERIAEGNKRMTHGGVRRHNGHHYGHF